MKHKRLHGYLALTLLLAGPVFATEDEHTHPHPGPEAAQPRDISIPTELLEKADFSALMELEGFASESDGTSESDLSLATIEVTIDADIVDNVGAHIGFLWEEDDTEENILDEGYLTFGGSDTVPFYLTVGKMYLPFGNFESEFINDPLTLELAEIRESAGIVGFGNGWIDLNAGAFNGDFEGASDDNTIDNAFASVAITPCEGFVFGAYWLSDLLETDGFSDLATSAVGAGYDYESTGGAGAYFHGHLGPVRFSGEYVAAVDEIDLPGGGMRPEAYHLEASLQLCEKVSSGLKFEGSNDFFADLGTDKWAAEQGGAVVSYAANDHVTLSGEYTHAEELDDDASADQITVQVSLVL